METLGLEIIYRLFYELYLEVDSQAAEELKVYVLLYSVQPDLLV